MANVSVVKIKVRRGTDAQRQTITPDLGELIYTTDGKRLFVGDGTTPGGINPYTLFTIIDSTNIITAQYVQYNDVVYDTSTSSFYTLTAGSNQYFGNYSILPILTLNNANRILPTALSATSTGGLFLSSFSTGGNYIGVK